VRELERLREATNRSVACGRLHFNGVAAIEGVAEARIGRACKSMGAPPASGANTELPSELGAHVPAVQ
jgi:hypothetical protein